MNTDVVAMLIFRLDADHDAANHETAADHDGLSACDNWRIATHTSLARNERLPLRS